MGKKTHFFVVYGKQVTGRLKADMKSELMIAITQLSAEKNLSKDVVLQAVEAALVSAYKKDNLALGPNVSVKINPTTGKVRIFAQKTVVEKPSDPKIELSLEDARRLKKNVQIDEIIEVEVTPANAGRIAAQTAKQVVMQRLREAERDAIFEEYAGKEGDILSGIVQRIEPKHVVIDLGRTEAILPTTEQVRTERYRPGQRLKVYLAEVVRSTSGPQIVVSRSHRNLLRRLFELEVPEIFKGAVEIKGIAREAGSRSKVAVAALQDGVDPVGSCVGLRGIRIQNIMNELSGEKIDVILWDPAPGAFIANALSPAQVVSVEAKEAEKVATVVVPDRQLSLAIGKEGQNARLAAKLTGWRIDIKSASSVEAEKAQKEPPAKAAAPAPEVKAEKKAVEAVAAAAPAQPEAATAKAAEKAAPVAPSVKEPVPAAAEAEGEIPEAAEAPAEIFLTPVEALSWGPEEKAPTGRPQLRFAEDLFAAASAKGEGRGKKRKKGMAKGEARGEITVKPKKSRARHEIQIPEVEEE